MYKLLTWCWARIGLGVQSQGGLLELHVLGLYHGREVCRLGSSSCQKGRGCHSHGSQAGVLQATLCSGLRYTSVYNASHSTTKMLFATDGAFATFI